MTLRQSTHSHHPRHHCSSLRPSLPPPWCPPIATATATPSIAAATLAPSIATAAPSIATATATPSITTAAAPPSIATAGGSLAGVPPPHRTSCCYALLHYLPVAAWKRFDGKPTGRGLGGQVPSHPGSLFYVVRVQGQNLVCKYWSGRLSRVELIIPSSYLSTVATPKPRLCANKPANSTQPPSFTNPPRPPPPTFKRPILSDPPPAGSFPPPSLPSIPIVGPQWDQPSTAEPTAEAQLAHALQRNYWLHDELPLRRLYLEQQKQVRGLSLIEELILASFQIDPAKVESIRNAEDLRIASVKADMLRHDQAGTSDSLCTAVSRCDDSSRAAGALGQAASRTTALEVASSEGWERAFDYPEQAARELQIRRLEIKSACQKQPFGTLVPDKRTSTEVCSVRRVHVVIPGEQVVCLASKSGTTEESVSTAGRICSGKDADGALRFGSGGARGAGSSGRRDFGDHQVARVILLRLCPLTDDQLDQFQADHINRNPSDCRLCNLQWISKKDHDCKSQYEASRSAERP